MGSEHAAVEGAAATGEAAPAVEATRWHGQPTAVWRERWGLPELRIFHSVASTNDVARALAEAGAPTGTVVIADEQTRGRGRRGRSWRAQPGRSLLLSVVLRPGPGAAVLPLRVGLAAARAVEALAGITVAIKWPNDLVAGGRKLGGILCEAAVEGGRSAFVAAGIGINVLQSADDWPPDLRGRATSIAAESGRTLGIVDLAARLVAEVSIATAAHGVILGPEELDELARRDALRGREVTVDGRPAGSAAGIEADGALLVRRENEIRRIGSGTIRLADAGEGRESDDA